MPVKKIYSLKMAIYDRKSMNHYTKYQIIKWGTVQIVLFMFLILILWCKAWSRDGFLLALTGFSYLIGTEILIPLDSFLQGYQIIENGILYYHRFQKKSIRYENIGSIVISCTFHRRYIGKRVKKNGRRYFMIYPWLTFCYGTPQKILKLHPYTLWSSMIDHKEDIIYSFCWNPRIIGDMIKNFKGNYYITHSIYVRYQDLVECLIEGYHIDRGRIFIMEDEELNI